MVGQVQNKTQTPIIGGKKSSSSFVFYINGKVVKLSKAEIETFRKIVIAKAPVAPGEQGVFGDMSLKQLKKHIKVLEKLVEIGLVKYVNVSGLRWYQVSEIGLQVYEMIKAME